MPKNIVYHLMQAIVYILLIVSLAGCESSDVPFFPNIQSRLEYLGSSAFDKRSAIMKDCGEAIIEALIKEDITIIEPILSSAASATADLNKGFEYSCNLFDDKIISFEGRTFSNGGYGSVSAFGNATFMIMSSYGTEYNLYFEYWFSNAESPELIGVNRIKVSNTKVAMADPNYVPGRSYDRSGIYNPDWDNSENAVNTNKLP